MAISIGDIPALQQAAGVLGLTPADEPQRNYLFETYVFGEDAFSDLRFFVKTINIPSSSREPIVVDYMDEKLIYSGKDSSTHSITVTLWDDQDLKVYEFLNDWMRLQGSSGMQGSDRHPFYTKKMQILLKDTTDFIINGTFEFTNVFPTEIGEVSLSYESSDIMEIPVTFTFDERSFDGSKDFGFDVGGLFGI